MNKVSCPICERELTGKSREDWPHFPFCSDRCRLIDLGRWLGEAYRVPDADAPSSASSDDEAETP